MNGIVVRQSRFFFNSNLWGNCVDMTFNTIQKKKPAYNKYISLQNGGCVCLYWIYSRTAPRAMPPFRRGTSFQNRTDVCNAASVITTVPSTLMFAHMPGGAKRLNTANASHAANAWRDVRAGYCVLNEPTCSPEARYEIRRHRHRCGRNLGC